MCKCIDEANKALKESDTYIQTTMLLDMETGVTRRVIMIPTALNRPKRGKKPLRIPANFCPLCGEKAA